MGLRFEEIALIETGEPLLDRCLNGGLRSNGAYMIASEQKAGKSSLARKLLFNFLSLGRKVLYFDTEQVFLEIVRSMLATQLRKPYGQVTEEDFESIDPILENLICHDSTEIGEIFEKEGKFDFAALEREIENKVGHGAEIIFYDNVTGLGATGSTQERMKLVGMLQRVSKKNNVLVVLVGHTPSIEVDTLTRDVIDKAVETGQFDAILNSTRRIVKRPAKPFGGSVNTQFDAIFMIWRLFQYWDAPNLASKSWLIVEETRYTKPFTIGMEFDGSCGHFEFKQVIGDDMGALGGWKTI
jgi:KaiC/GvpD/RAD55 family RecA-like ATPase